MRHRLHQFSGLMMYIHSGLSVGEEMQSIDIIQLLVLDHMPRA